MCMKRPGIVLFAALLAALSGGCKKSTPDSAPPPASNAPPASAESVVRLHWLGKKRLASETNASLIMSTWNLPESVKLEAQTLEKLAVAPWALLQGNTTAVDTNVVNALFRPVAEDWA